MELTGTQGCSEEESSVIQSVLETLAAECYVLGLRENSRLGGALVLRFDIDPAGWIATYELVTDALLSAGGDGVPRGDGPPGAPPGASDERWASGSRDGRVSRCAERLTGQQVPLSSAAEVGQAGSGDEAK